MSWKPIEKTVADKPIWVILYMIPVEDNDRPGYKGPWPDVHGWYETEEEAIKVLQHFPDQVPGHPRYWLRKAWKRELEVDPDVLTVRAILHAAQRAVPNDYPWGDMSYIKGSYDHLDAFKAALTAYRKQKKETAA